MLLTEIFSKPAPIQKISSTTYRFELDSDTYYIRFKQTVVPSDYLPDNVEGGDAVEVSFYTMDESKRPEISLTGKGNAFQVLGTVIAATSKWVSQHKPDYVIFSADKDETSRVNLYRRLMKTHNIQHYNIDGDQPGRLYGTGDVLFIVPANQFT